MKFGRLEVQVIVHLSKKVKHPSKVKGIYTGRICDICQAVVKGGQKAYHLQEVHPEYRFRAESRASSSSLTYVCLVCQQTVGGVSGVVQHYREKHNEVLTQSNQR